MHPLHGTATFCRGFSTEVSSHVMRLRSRFEPSMSSADFALVRSRKELQEAACARSVCWVAHESGGLKSLQRSDEGRCIQRQG
jgi:hypothetical protein